MQRAVDKGFGDAYRRLVGRESHMVAATREELPDAHRNSCDWNPDLTAVANEAVGPTNNGVI